MLSQPQSGQVIFLIGIPATGKSTFYKALFYDSHVRINRDMLKTAHREKTLFNTCLQLSQSVVIDNTNVTTSKRAYFINMAKSAGFTVAGYYFQSSVTDAIKRNQQRAAEQIIPEKGVRGLHAQLELPTFDEGFDALYYVKIAPQEAAGTVASAPKHEPQFIIEQWQDNPSIRAESAI